MSDGNRAHVVVESFEKLCASPHLLRDLEERYDGWRRGERHRIDLSCDDRVHESVDRCEVLGEFPPIRCHNVEFTVAERRESLVWDVSVALKPHWPIGDTEFERELDHRRARFFLAARSVRKTPLANGATAFRSAANDLCRGEVVEDPLLERILKYVEPRINALPGRHEERRRGCLEKSVGFFDQCRVVLDWNDAHRGSMECFGSGALKSRDLVIGTSGSGHGHAQTGKRTLSRFGCGGRVRDAHVNSSYSVAASGVVSVSSAEVSRTLTTSPITMIAGFVTLRERASSIAAPSVVNVWRSRAV